MFNPNNGLFTLSPNNNNYYPNPLSSVQKNQKYFNFIGKIIGKALIDNKIMQ